MAIHYKNHILLTGKGNPMAKTLIEQMQELEAEYAKIAAKKAELMEGAKKEALAKVEAAIEELNALGYNYRLNQLGDKPAKSSGSGQKAPRKVSDGPCPICNFKTAPHHDRRAHRSQAEKKPFTAEELTSLGYTKVG